MATKTVFRWSDGTQSAGYMVDEILGLYQEEDKMWTSVHIPTKFAFGKSRFKRKRACMAFTENLENVFDLDFSTKEEFYERNGGKENAFALFEIEVGKVRELDK